MDKEFIRLLDDVIPDGTETTKAYNANRKINKEDLEELCRIPIEKYDESCLIMKRLIERIKGEDKTIPLRYRKAIFFIIYREYYQNTKKNGVQKATIDKIGLSHNVLTKWGLNPILACREGNDLGANLKIKRDGKKNEILTFLINGIISNVEYKTLIEPFSGLGTITASVLMRKGVCGCFNDIDKTIANVLGAIKYKPVELKQECVRILEEIKLKLHEDTFKEGKKKYEERIEHQKRRLKLCTDLEKQHEIKELIKMLNTAEDKEDIQYALGIHADFTEKIRGYQEKTQDEKRGFIVNEDVVDLKMASAFLYLHSLTFKNNTSVTGVNSKNLKVFKDNISLINDYSKRLKKVEIRCGSFRDMLENENFNTTDTLCYIDMPYFRTKQYHHGFTDKDHMELHDTLQGFKGKVIISCKEKSTNNSKYRDKKEGEVMIESFIEYLEMYKDIAKYVARINEDKNYEIVLSNFDFDLPNINTLRYLKGEDIDDEDEEECGFIKETYEEFLIRVKSRDRLDSLMTRIYKYAHNVRKS